MDHADRPNPDARLDRRGLLKGAAVAGVAAAMQPFAAAHSHAAPQAAAARSSLIRDENQKPGTTDWQLTYTRIDPATKFRCPWIEGYVSRASVRAGETLDSVVSTDPASPFAIDLYRLGYYGGTGGRHVTALGPFDGKPQPDPPVGERAAARVPVGAVHDARRSRGLAQRRLPRQAVAATKAAIRATSSSSSATTGRPTSSSSAATTPGRPTTAGPTTTRSTTTTAQDRMVPRLRREGQLRPALRQVRARSSTTRCRRARASSCSGSSRSPSGWSSTATT